jgi:hypothetical protein
MFNISINIIDGLSTSQVEIFNTSAERWSEVIIGDLPSANLNGTKIDDLLIDASGISIDGPGRVLGQAGPTHLRSGSMLPVKGIMEFDTGDLDQLEDNGGLMDVILHEMGHVIGIGTLWQSLGLLDGGGSDNPTFCGKGAMREYADLIDQTKPTPVPVANTGGPGTRDGHWREQTFGDELMTGFLSGASRPLSRLTVASLADIGYEVCLDAAERYELPSEDALVKLGIMGDEPFYHRCDIARPVPVIIQ